MSLNLKETMAIELRYLGNTIKQIAQKIEVPEKTVENWFSSAGRLYIPYNEYAVDMNEKRRAKVEEKITVTDEEFFIITTNIVRHIGRSLQTRKAPLVNEQGQVVTDNNGNPKYIEIEPEANFSVGDLKTVWQMQRIMRGLPINHEKQDVEQTNFEADEVIKALGLTPEDFENDKLEETTKLITKHLLSQ